MPGLLDAEVAHGRPVVLLAGIARMSWQHAMRAGSWVCIQAKNESIAASRWLLVDEFPRLVRSQSRNPVTAAASISSRVSRSGEPLVAEVQINSVNASR